MTSLCTSLFGGSTGQQLCALTQLRMINWARSTKCVSLYSCVSTAGQHGVYLNLKTDVTALKYSWMTDTVAWWLVHLCSRWWSSCIPYSVTVHSIIIKTICESPNGTKQGTNRPTVSIIEPYVAKMWTQNKGSTKSITGWLTFTCNVNNDVILVSSGNRVSKVRHLYRILIGDNPLNFESFIFSLAAVASCLTCMCEWDRSHRMIVRVHTECSRKG